MGRAYVFSALSGVNVDADKGILFGVSLISEGPALGHNLIVDSTTIEQISSACNRFSNGVKVKLEHSGGVADIVGTVRNIRASQGKLLGDLHLLQTAALRGYILELAQTAPDTFGLSVNFNGTPDGNLARCSRIRSVDLVADPAANPDGLFEEVDTKTGGNMPDAPATPTPAAAPSDMEDRLSQIEGRLTAIEELIKQAMDAEKKEGEGQPPEPPAAGDKPTGLSEPLVQLSTKLDALSELVKNLSSVSVSNAQGTGTTPQKQITFSEKVNELVAAGKTKAEATVFVVKNHPDLHKAFLTEKGATLR